MSLSARARRGSRVILLAMVAMLGCSFAAAQDEDTGPYREKDIRYMEHSKPYLQWALGVLFVAGCLVLAFKNPHRTHLD